jgi:hypothetical protein
MTTPAEWTNRVGCRPTLVQGACGITWLATKSPLGSTAARTARSRCRVRVS